MTMAYKGSSLKDLQMSETIESRRKHLFDIYVDEMFKRRNASPLYTREQTKQCLKWLGKNVNAHAQSVFLIEGIQPSWLKTLAQRLFYEIGFRSFEIDPNQS